VRDLAPVGFGRAPELPPIIASATEGFVMANTAKWNVRLRHEWLQSPLKKKRVKKNEKVRVGLWDAEQRKVAKPAPSAESNG
jgi:hypothetical protein